MTGAAEPLLDATTLRATAHRLAGAIDADHPGGVVLVGVLDGCLCFLADLARAIAVPCRIDVLSLSRFAPGRARVRVLKDLDLDVTGAEVVLVEDIVDTGLSARYVVRLLEEHGAARVEVCTLLDRPSRRIVPLPLRYVGHEAPDDFLVGYGLDYAGRYRNLPGIYLADLAALGADPAACEDLYAPGPAQEPPGPAYRKEPGRS